MSIPKNQTILRTLERSLPNRSHVVATFGLRYIEGNQSAYWTLTGELYESHGTWSGEARRRNDREPDCSGAITDEILRAFPRLAPFAALHLADVDGVPMHAVENGRYYLQHGQVKTAAKHFRCAVDELPAVDNVETFVNARRERWAVESRAAFDLLLAA